MMKCDVIAIVAKLNAMSRPGHSTALPFRPHGQTTRDPYTTWFLFSSCCSAAVSTTTKVPGAAEEFLLNFPIGFALIEIPHQLRQSRRLLIDESWWTARDKHSRSMDASSSLEAKCFVLFLFFLPPGRIDRTGADNNSKTLPFWYQVSAGRREAWLIIFFFFSIFICLTKWKYCVYVISWFRCVAPRGIFFLPCRNNVIDFISAKRNIITA